MKRTFEIIALSASCAMLAAGAQLLRNSYVRHIVNGYAWMTQDAAWMAPLAFLAYFGPLALVMAVGAAAAPRLVTRRVVVFITMTLTLWSVALHFTKLAPITLLLLAVGGAVQLTAFLERSPSRWFHALNVVGVSLAALFVLMGIGGHVVRAFTQTRQLAALGSAEPAAPNVLVIVLDTVRAASMGLYNSTEKTTPFLSRVATESVVFDRAIAPSSWTLPSHASMFTGMLPSKLDVSWYTPTKQAYTMLAETFLRRGYATGAFTANYLYTSHESPLTPGFLHHQDHRVTAKEVLWHANLTQLLLGNGPLLHVRSARAAWRGLTTGNNNVPIEMAHDIFRAGDVVDAFLGWRDAVHGRPYFAFLNFFDAHGEFRAPHSFSKMFSGGTNMMRNYRANIAYIDAQLERLVEHLRAVDELDHTVLFVTSDHGNQFKEHGLFGHANSLYMEVLHVPLLIRFPKRLPSGARVHEPVSLADAAATIASLSGADASAFPGQPMPPLREPRDGGETVIAETAQTKGTGGPTDLGSMISVVSGRLHYIRRADGKEELYNYHADPHELCDLSAAAAGAAELSRMRERYGTVLMSR
jgi:arylsulfatase A-like enzyme